MVAGKDAALIVQSAMAPRPEPRPAIRHAQTKSQALGGGKHADAKDRLTAGTAARSIILVAQIPKSEAVQLGIKALATEAENVGGGGAVVFGKF